MSDASNWRDVKAAARTADPEWDSPERVARRGRMREQMLASVSGAQLAEIRKQHPVQRPLEAVSLDCCTTSAMARRSAASETCRSSSSSVSPTSRS
jgi:hypothetical protein